MRFRRLCLAAMSVPSLVCAHEHSLTPGAYVATPGRPVAISARIGEGLCGETKAYRTERTVRFVMRGERAFDLAVLAADRDSTWARLRAADDRGVLIAWESNFVPHRMEAAPFDAYLESDGLDGPRALRYSARDTSAGRERYRRCSKLWLAGSDIAAAVARRVTEPVGLPLELVPLDVPGRVKELRVRLLFDGKPLPGALVQAWNVPLAADGGLGPCAESSGTAAWRGRTDSDGMVIVPCGATGAWLIGSVHMIPCAAREEADWESTWASLSFARKDAGATSARPVEAAGTERRDRR